LDIPKTSELTTIDQWSFRKLTRMGMPKLSAEVANLRRRVLSAESARI